MSVTRYMGGLAATLLLGVAGASGAAADPPDIDRTPLGTQTVLHTECGFDVLEETKVGENLVQTFYDRNGDLRTIHVAGSFHGTLTNVDTGESIQLNFSGAGTIDPETGALTGHGPFFISSPDDPTTPEFDGYMVLTTGTTAASLDFETGLITINSTTSSDHRHLRRSGVEQHEGGPGRVNRGRLLLLQSQDTATPHGRRPHRRAHPALAGCVLGPPHALSEARRTE